MIVCPGCEGHVQVHPPKGRWLIDPNLFVRQNPVMVPLGYNVLLTEEGTKLAECECGLHFEVVWEIVWSLAHDRQGGPVRYLMGHPIRFKPCPYCEHRWTPHGDDYCPTEIDGRNSCTECVKRAREVFGDWIMR